MALFLFKIKKHLVSLVLSQLLPHPNIFIHATAVSHLPILARGAQLPWLRYFPPQKNRGKDTPYVKKGVFRNDHNFGGQWRSFNDLNDSIDLKTSI